MIKALIPLLLLAGATTASAQDDRRLAKERAELDRELSRFAPDRPQDCIRQVDARSSRIYGNTVLFKVSSGLIYRNDTRGSCSNSGFQTAFQTESSVNQLCAGQAARTFDPTAGVLTGACTLGEFVPYRRR